MSTHHEPSAPRVLWKGAITFGLVHIPVALYSATVDAALDFDWLDRRSMDPVGYKRINKKTGKEIDRDDIVKGIAQDDGRYVVLSDDEIAAAYPKTTQTVEIEAFVGADEIPFVYFDRPYYVGPINKGEKVYALLRETLKRTGRIGLAKVVIATKQHLAALIPSGAALVLMLLRWGENIRPLDALPLPGEGMKATGLNARELRMAEQLVADMEGEWDADEFRDEFKDKILALVEKKAKAGDLQTVEPLEEAGADGSGSADVIDLTALLQRSLRAGRAATLPAAGAKKSARAATADADADDKEAAPRPAARGARGDGGHSTARPSAVASTTRKRRAA